METAGQHALKVAKPVSLEMGLACCESAALQQCEAQHWAMMAVLVVEERGAWKSKFDFSVAFLALTLGFQHIFRFPYLVFKNGGGLTVTLYNMHV